MFLLVVLVFGCEEEVYIPQYHRPELIHNISCGDYLKPLAIKGLDYIGCERIELHIPSHEYVATYFLRLENAVNVEKQLIQKLNIKSFTNLTLSNIFKHDIHEYVYIDNTGIGLDILLDITPLSFQNRMRKRADYNYIIKAIKFVKYD